MSLRLRIAAVIRPQYYSAAASTSKTMWRDTDEIINKVLDAAVEASKEIKPVSHHLHGSTNDLYYMFDIVEAIQRLKGEK